MVDFPSVALAFAAGVFTVFSPCSFPLLPGYFSYRLTVSDSRLGALAAGLICAVGLVGVFCLIAFLLSVVGAILSSYIEMLPLLSGVIISMMGVLTVSGKGFSYSPLPVKIHTGHNLLGTLGYGIAYGFASTGCSAPVFYSVVLYSLASGGTLEGAVTFIVYSLGVGVPLVVISLLVGLGRTALVQRFSRSTPMLQKVSGILLIAFGLYQIYSYLSTP